MILIMTDLSKQSILTQIRFRNLFQRMWAEYVIQCKMHDFDVEGSKHRWIISEAILWIA